MGSDPNHRSTLCYRVKSNNQQVRPLGRESWLRRVCGFRKTLKNPKRSFDIILKILIRILSNSCQALMEAYWTTQKRVCKNSAELTQFRRRFTSFPMKSVGVTSLKNVFHLWTFSELYQHICAKGDNDACPNVIFFELLRFNFQVFRDGFQYIVPFLENLLPEKVDFPENFTSWEIWLLGKGDFPKKITAGSHMYGILRTLGHLDICTFISVKKLRG